MEKTFEAPCPCVLNCFTKFMAEWKIMIWKLAMYNVTQLGVAVLRIADSDDESAVMLGTY